MRLGAYVKYEEKLSGDYKKAFSEIEGYGDAHMVRGSYKNEKMMDLMDLLITAQEKEIPVEKVVGSDISKFAKGFFSDLTLGRYLFEYLDLLKLWAWLALVFGLFMIISEAGEPDFDIFTLKTDIPEYLLAIFIGFFGGIISNIILVIITGLNNYSKKVDLIVTIITVVVVTAACVLLNVAKVKIEVRAIPVLIITTVFLIAYYSIAYIGRKRLTGSFKKVKNEYESSISELVGSELKQTDYSQDSMYLKAYSKRFKRKNERREGKGLPPYTTREFIENESKFGRHSAMLGYTMGVTVVVAVEFFRGDFDSIGSFAVFMIMVFVIGFFLGRAQRSINNLNSKANKDIIMVCEEKGMEVDELYEAFLNKKDNDNSLRL